MKFASFLLLSMMLSMFLQNSAICADHVIESQRILGEYTGTMELFTGRQLKNYGYIVTVEQVDIDKNELSLKIECNDCEKRVSTMSGCSIINVTPTLQFGCKGETWHVDYQLDGDVLKGKGITSKGKPYSVSAKKIQKL